MNTSGQEHTDNRKAVIYMRVANLDPAVKPDAFEWQERRCRDYASVRGYSVAGVFSDAGVSGSIGERSGLNSMLTYLEAARGEGVVVLMEDAARLARDISLMIALSNQIRDTGAQIEFCDEPEGATLPSPMTNQIARRIQP